MFSFVARQQVPRYQSSNSRPALRAASTWVYVDYYKLENKYCKIPSNQIGNLFALRKELLAVLPVLHPVADRLVFYDAKNGKELDDTDQAPENRKDNPIWATVKLTDEEEAQQKQAELSQKQAELSQKQAEKFCKALLNTELEQLSIPDNWHDEDEKPDPIYMLSDIPGHLPEK